MVAFLQSHWEQILLWVSAISLLALAATLVALPWAVTRLPADYFNRSKRRVWHRITPYPMLNVVLVVLKNCLGLIFVLLGLLLLFTPGQGILTIVAGVALMNFPGKYTIERKVVLSTGVLRGINWIRKRRGYPPISAPE